MAMISYEVRLAQHFCKMTSQTTQNSTNNNWSCYNRLQQKARQYWFKNNGVGWGIAN